MSPIRLIHPDDFPQISHIWRVCFGDPADYVKFFWEHCLPLCRGLAYEQDGHLAAMAFLLPGALALREDAHPASYVYAVATLPEHRSRGFAAALTAHAASLAREEGQAALCLRPGSEGLYGYYAKLGFSAGFTRQDFSPPARENRPELFNADAAAAYRKNCWNELGFFAWPPPLLDCMAKEHLFRGGEIFLEESGYAFIEGNQVRERCVCESTNLPGGMILPLNDDGKRWLARSGGRGYLGLTLE